MELIQILNTVKANPYSAFFFTPPIYGNSYSYLFADPFEIISVEVMEQADKKFKEIDKLIAKGYSAYALLNYETGFLFEKKLYKLIRKKQHFGEFIFFKEKNVIKYDSSIFKFSPEKENSYRINNFKLNTNKGSFYKRILAVKKFIEAGDTYQVNFTVKGKFSFEGDISNLFITLMNNQSGRYSAFINSGKQFILSISPELFFEIKGNKISVRPMKGTARRGIDLQKDNKIKLDLALSEKNRAENIMIVDLLRNDLGRISKIDSVKVDKLFEVEKYESLFQMVSEISSNLKKNISLTDVLRNIFPCGSITGAPKFRTMEIINEIEKEPRGIYTGSIGLIHKKKTVFNVAIRTLVIDKKTKKGEIGLGSGIVWDSDASQEFEETVLKSKFLTKPDKDFELFETMLLENGQITFLEDHLDRLKASASYFLFIYNDSEIRKAIRRIVSSNPNYGRQKIKLLLNKWGKIRSEIKEVDHFNENVDVILSNSRIHSNNRFNYFKTTNRKIYDREHIQFSKKGFYDVLYFNDKNELAEGSITNIFLKLGDTFFTPPVNSGILAGVYRKNLMRNDSNIKERTLYYEDLMLAEELILTNAIRGKIRVNKLYTNETEYKSFG